MKIVVFVSGFCIKCILKVSILINVYKSIKKCYLFSCCFIVEFYRITFGVEVY